MPATLDSTYATKDASYLNKLSTLIKNDEIKNMDNPGATEIDYLSQLFFNTPNIETGSTSNTIPSEV